MTKMKITAGGQLSLPAAIRHRWGVRYVAVEDLGDRVVLRPVPDDPIGAVRGLLRGKVPSTKALRARARADEERALRKR